VVSTSSQTLVNGRATAQVAALDRGLSYGDGVFRTLRVDGGRPCWWGEHLDKLKEDCRRLGLACPPPAVWEQDLGRLDLPASGVVRLTVTRGEAPRGYAPPPHSQSTRIVTVWPHEHAPLSEEGITARVCHLRLGHQPALAGVKHLNRLENVLARAEWQDADIREGILLDQPGQVVGGVMSNLFLWHGGRLRTPRLDKCGVAGVARARLMAAATRAGYRVEETELTLGDVYAADELFFTNSLILLWRVARLENRSWGTPVVSQALWELLHA